MLYAGERGVAALPCLPDALVVRHPFTTVIIPAGINRCRQIKLLRRTTVPLSHGPAEALTGLSLLRCAELPAVQGIHRSKAGLRGERARDTVYGRRPAPSSPTPPSISEIPCFSAAAYLARTHLGRRQCAGSPGLRILWSWPAPVCRTHLSWPEAVCTVATC
jgi:hypothetical protein